MDCTEQKFNYWKIAFLSIILVAISIRLFAGVGEYFDYDTYAMMRGVDKSFADYKSIIKGYFGLPLLVYYWLSYRVFGGGVYNYVVIPVALSLATIAVLHFFIRKFWKDDYFFCFFIMALFAYNSHSIGLTFYPMVTYVFSLLVSILLFFLFLRLTDRPLTKLQWRILSLLFIPAAFFTNITVLVPVVSGIAALALYRWLIDKEKLSTLFRTFWETKALMVFPINYYVIDIMYRYTNGNLSDRPGWYPLLFTSGHYPQNLFGFKKYFIENIYTLLTGLLSTQYNLGHKQLQAVVAVVAIVILYKIYKKEMDKYTIFTAFFVLITWSAIFVGGLIGKFPYGNVRYADYLLVPLLILIARAITVIIGWGLKTVGLDWKAKLLLVMLIVINICIGGFFTVKNYRENVDVSRQNLQAFETAKTVDADAVLYMSYFEPFIYVKAPEIYNSGIDIGWGSYWNSGKIEPAEKLLKMKDSWKNKTSVKTVVVIAPSKEGFSEEFSAYDAVLQKDFKLVKQISAPNMWTAIYKY